MTDPVSTVVAALEARLVSEVSEVALLADIEGTLANLRERYRRQRAAFDAPTVAKLKRLRDRAQGLRLFIAHLDCRDALVDTTDFECARGDYGTLLVLFDGCAVRVRMQRALDSLQAREAEMSQRAVKTPPVPHTVVPAATVATVDLFADAAA